MSKHFQLSREERSILKVAFPGGGKMYILRWYEHDEGHHIILASSIESIKTTFQRVLREHGENIEVVNFEQINIVAPPQKLQDAFAEEVYKDDVRRLRDVVVDHAQDFLKHFGKLPEELTSCTEYKCLYDNPDSPEEDSPESEDERHYSCANCVQKMKLRSGTWEDLYAQKSYIFEQVFPPRPHYPDNFCTSRAQEGDRTKPYYAVYSNFGHHCDGLKPHEVTAISLHNIPLFYYQDPIVLDNSDFETLIEELKNKNKEEQIRRKLVWDKKTDKEREERFNLLRRLLSRE